MTSWLTEKERKESDTRPPDWGKWSEQLSRVNLFNMWIGNVDANLTNMLITNDWDLRIIDFTRAFHPISKLASDLPVRIDRSIYETLESVTEETIRELVGPYLRKSEIRALMQRRDQIVEFYAQRVAERGAEIVLRESA